MSDNQTSSRPSENLFYWLGVIAATVCLVLAFMGNTEIGWRFEHLDVPASWAAGLIDAVRTGWRNHGREGAPRIVAQVNTALGPPAVIDDARSAIARYYQFSDRADSMVEGMLTTPGQIRAAIAQFEDLGVDEVMLYCHGRDPGQADRLAEVL